MLSIWSKYDWRGKRAQAGCGDIVFVSCGHNVAFFFSLKLFFGVLAVYSTYINPLRFECRQAKAELEQSKLETLQFEKVQL